MVGLGLDFGGSRQEAGVFNRRGAEAQRGKEEHEDGGWKMEDGKSNSMILAILNPPSSRFSLCVSAPLR
jgi:hypothetical protein